MIYQWPLHLASLYGSGAYNDQNYNGTGAVVVGPITIPSTGNVTIGTTTLPVTGPAFLSIVGALLLALAAGAAWWLYQRRQRSKA